ncbi:hypothetical protein NOCARDAX2BIS_230071 [Nocardioides sp. AX2bis]|nr:hypothetical protein NOCARDAX2BIS_230071 [Nocardioides sp. AX2bis]
MGVQHDGQQGRRQVRRGRVAPVVAHRVPGARRHARPRRLHHRGGARDRRPRRRDRPGADPGRRGAGRPAGVLPGALPHDGLTDRLTVSRGGRGPIVPDEIVAEPAGPRRFRQGLPAPARVSRGR